MAGKPPISFNDFSSYKPPFSSGMFDFSWFLHVESSGSPIVCHRFPVGKTAGFFPCPPHVTSCVRSSSELSPQIRRWRAQSGVLQKNPPRNHGFSRNSKQQSKHGSHSNIFQHFSNHGLLLLLHVEGNSHGTSWDKRDKPARAPAKNFMASTPNLGDPGTPGTEPLWICSPLPKFLIKSPQLVVIPAKKVASARVLGLELVRSLNHISFLSYSYLLSLLTIGG